MSGLNSAELRYWEALLSERMDAALQELYELAPWLAPALEPELRVCMRDATFTPLIAELSKVPALGDLPDAYRAHPRPAAGAPLEFPAALSHAARCSGAVARGNSRPRATPRSIWRAVSKASRHWRSATSTTWTLASCSTKIASSCASAITWMPARATNPTTICWRPKPGLRFSWRSPKATSRARLGYGWDAS